MTRLWRSWTAAGCAACASRASIALENRTTGGCSPPYLQPHKISHPVWPIAAVELKPNDFYASADSGSSPVSPPGSARTRPALLRAVAWWATSTPYEPELRQHTGLK